MMAARPNDEARVAFDRAIALATIPRGRPYRMHLDRLMRDSQPRGEKAGTCRGRSRKLHRTPIIRRSVIAWRSQRCGATLGHEHFGG